MSMPNNTVAIGARYNDKRNQCGPCAHIPLGRAHGFKGVDINGEAASDESGWSVSMPDVIPWLLGLSK